MDNRYKEVIKRLKRLLEAERRNLRTVREAYADDMQQKTELELFLKECIEDVSAEILLKTKKRNDPTTKFDVVPEKNYTEFNAPDRARVMELLLSQERVIALLYAKTFPISNEDSSPSIETMLETKGTV